jgi:hypothetical protein
MGAKSLLINKFTGHEHNHFAFREDEGKSSVVGSMSVLKRQEYETARQTDCNPATILLSFNHLSDCMKYDRLLLKNADETQIKSRQLFEALAAAGKVPIIENTDP